jgi:hypothetical protein
MERQRRRPTNMPVAALAVKVAARLALFRLKVSSVKSGTSSSHISSTCKQNDDLVFKWKRCLKNLEYISNNEIRNHTCQWTKSDMRPLLPSSGTIICGVWVSTKPPTLQGEAPYAWSAELQTSVW